MSVSETSRVQVRKERRLLRAFERFPLLTLAIGVLLGYLPYLWNSYTEDNVKLIATTYNFLIQYLAQQRYGVVAVIYLLFGTDVSVFDTWLAGFVNVGLLILLAWGFYALVRKTWRLTREKKWAAIVCGILFVLNPAVYGMLFFRVQSISVLLAMLAVLLVGWFWIGSGNWMALRIVSSALWLAGVMLTYQTVILFAVALAIFFLLSDFERKLQLFVVSGLSVLGAVAAYFAVTQVADGMFSNLTLGSYGVGGDLDYYLKWTALGNNPYYFSLIIFLLAMSAVVFQLFVSLGRKYWDNFLFSGLILTLFALDLLFGNTTLPSRMYIGVLGIVLCAIFLRNLQGKVNMLVSMSIFLMAVIYVVNLGAVGRANYAMLGMLILMSILLILQKPRLGQLLVVVLVLAGLNWNSIILQKISTDENNQMVSRVIESLEEQGVSRQEAQNYHFFVDYHRQTDRRFLAALSQAWIGQPVMNLAFETPSMSQSNLKETFQVQGYHFKGNVKYLDEVLSEKFEAAQFVRNLDSVSADGDNIVAIDERPNMKNIYIKLGSEGASRE